MLENLLPDGLYLEEVARIYVNLRRRRISDAISKSSDDISMLEVYDMIVNIEDDMLDRVEDDLPDMTEPMIRSMVQQALIERMVEKHE